MEELRKIYREGIPPKILALEEALREYRQGSTEGKASIIRMAHALRGSGGTYGFPKITASADQLEHSPEEQIDRNTEDLISVLREVIGES